MPVNVNGVTLGNTFSAGSYEVPSMVVFVHTRAVLSAKRAPFLWGLSTGDGLYPPPFIHPGRLTDTDACRHTHTLAHMHATTKTSQVLGTHQPHYITQVFPEKKGYSHILTTGQRRTLSHCSFTFPFNPRRHKEIVLTDTSSLPVLSCTESGVTYFFLDFSSIFLFIAFLLSFAEWWFRNPLWLNECWYIDR